MYWCCILPSLIFTDAKFYNSDKLLFTEVLAHELLEAGFKIFLACDEVVESFTGFISDAILVLEANKLKTQGKEPIYTDDKNDRSNGLGRHILEIFHSLLEIAEMFEFFGS